MIIILTSFVQIRALRLFAKVWMDWVLGKVPVLLLDLASVAGHCVTKKTTCSFFPVLSSSSSWLTISIVISLSKKSLATAPIIPVGDSVVTWFNWCIYDNNTGGVLLHVCITRNNVAEPSAVWVIVEKHCTIRVPLHPKWRCIHFLQASNNQQYNIILFMARTIQAKQETYRHS